MRHSRGVGSRKAAPAPGDLRLTRPGRLVADSVAALFVDADEAETEAVVVGHADQSARKGSIPGD